MISFPLRANSRCASILLPDMPPRPNEKDCYLFPAPGPIRECGSPLSLLSATSGVPWHKIEFPDIDFKTRFELVDDLNEVGMSVSLVSTDLPYRILYLIRTKIFHGPTYVILFKIEQVNNYIPTDVFVLAQVLGFAPTYVTDLPEMTPTKKVYIFDPLHAIFVDPPEQLINRVGIAVYMNVAPPGAYENLMWVAIGLACPPETNA